MKTDIIKKTFLDDGVVLLKNVWNRAVIQEIIKEYLVNYYDLELSNYSSIEFNIFPLPNLSIKDINLKVKDKPISFDTKNLNIFSCNFLGFGRRLHFINSIISIISTPTIMVEFFEKLFKCF